MKTYAKTPESYRKPMQAKASATGRETAQQALREYKSGAVQLRRMSESLPPVSEGPLQLQAEDEWEDALSDAALIPEEEEEEEPLQASAMQPVSQRTPAPDAPRAVAGAGRAGSGAGLPETLQANMETLSGFSMDDVTVHYNSPEPARIQAHAYTRGTDIHVAPGQEKHLPHEAWHVVQQKQGRVEATETYQGKQLNTDHKLEHEADSYGNKTLQLKTTGSSRKIPSSMHDRVVQMQMGKAMSSLFRIKHNLHPVIAHWAVYRGHDWNHAEEIYNLIVLYRNEGEETRNLIDDTGGNVPIQQIAVLVAAARARDANATMQQIRQMLTEGGNAVNRCIDFTALITHVPAGVTIPQIRDLVHAAKTNGAGTTVGQIDALLQLMPAGLTLVTDLTNLFQRNNVNTLQHVDALRASMDPKTLDRFNALSNTLQWFHHQLAPGLTPAILTSNTICAYGQARFNHWPHILSRHTYENFNFAEVRELQGFYPNGSNYAGLHGIIQPLIKNMTLAQVRGVFDGGTHMIGDYAIMSLWRDCWIRTIYPTGTAAHMEIRRNEINALHDLR